MIEQSTVNLIGFTALAFSLVFVYTSTIPECTYRRYLVPGMLVAIAAMVMQEAVASLMLAVSAIMFYSGYKGYGIKKKEEEKNESSD